MAYDPNQKRHKKGSPTAGAWAADNARGGAVAVAEQRHGQSAIVADPMTVQWLERDVLPTPRHRIPRDVPHEFELQPEFTSIPLEASGEAFTIEDGYHKNQRDYRHYDGELYRAVLAEDIFSYRGDEPAPDYAPYPNRTDHVEGTPDRLTGIISETRSQWNGNEKTGHRQEFRDRGYESEEEAREAVEEAVAQYVVIDGKLWRKTPEPVYEVNTFGLGNNHGGTALMHSTRHSVDGRIRNDNVFTLDEFEAAKRHALSVAEARGDTEDLERIRNKQPIATVAEDRPWAHPTPPIRVPDVPNQFDVPYEDRENIDQYKLRMQKIRRQVEQYAPDSIYTDPETGKRKVDFSQMTVGVEDSYRYYAKRIHELSEPDLDSF